MRNAWKRAGVQVASFTAHYALPLRRPLPYPADMIAAKQLYCV
jgi:hypothetical protein